MDFQQLIQSMPHKKGSLWWLEKGERTGRSYSALYQDIQEARQNLLGWGVSPEPGWVFTPQFLALVGIRPGAH